MTTATDSESPPPATPPWQARVLTLFPEMFPGPLGHSIIGRGLERGLWSLATHNIRDFAPGKHRQVDDTPAGGGPGMVMRADVAAAALDAARAALPEAPAFYLSPRGAPFTQAQARELAAGPGLVLLCGRFEGLDERLLEARDIVELSVGDYVLAGGELAAMVVLEACVRLLPGVTGNASSIREESFEHGLLEHPHYTRPALWEGREIPAVLTSGNHAAVARWRRQMAERLTRTRRPDLWARRTK